MSDLVTNLNTLTTKVAALRTKAKNKATELDSSVVIANTDTISDIVGKMQGGAKKVELTNTYTFKDSIQNYIDNLVTFKSLPSNCAYYFQYETGLKTVPFFDTSNVTNMSNMFCLCNSLQTIPLFNTSNVTNMDSMFYNCDVLQTIPLFDTSKVTNMNNMFYSTARATVMPKINTENVIIFSSFCSLSNFEKVEELNVKSAVLFQGVFYSNRNLSYILLKNFGTQNNIILTSQTFTETIWGQGSDENRQSLVDSLLTYSFDRATAGYSTLTIKLPTASLALLTDAEKAAITAKGYTLTA